MSAPPGPATSPAPPREPLSVRLLCWAVLLGAIALGSWARIHFVLTDVNFDRTNPDLLLRSDPALVYYVTERIVEGGGLPPADFRADMRVTWPEPADLPAMFAVAQEFLVAWAFLLFGDGVPLHVMCLYVMAVVASLGAVGVFGLAHELTRSLRWAAVAAVAFALLPLNYRTLGGLLQNEDLSLPLFVAHLWLVARAARTDGLASWIGAGLTLVLALASWHAMAFFVSLEVAVLFGWFLLRGENPFARRRACIVPALAALAALAIPVLWSKRFLVSPAMLATGSLLALSWLPPVAAWSAAHARRAALALALVLGAALCVRFSGAQDDYGHVFGLIVAKIAHLGRFPADPASVDFDTRLLWQGPFITARWSPVAHDLGLAGIVTACAIAFAAWRGWARREERAFLLVAALCALGGFSGWLIERTLVLIGLLAPVLCVALASRLKPVLGLGLAALLLAGELSLSVRRVRMSHGQYVYWYAEVPDRNRELAHLLRFARASLPSDAAILSDYVTSPALLAANGNPIVCQPKYETAASRRRIEEFCQAYLRGTPQDFLDMARRYGCRYAVIDRIGNWYLLGYPAGYPLSQVNTSPPPPGTAAAVFGSSDDAVLTSVPGMRLVYRTPPGGMGFYRVYEIE